MKRDELFIPGSYCSMPKILQATPNTILSPVAKDIWQALAERQGENDTAWPSYQTIARDIGASRRSAINEVKTLVAYQLIACTDRHENDNGTGWTWHIVPTLPTPLLSLNTELAKARRGEATSLLKSIKWHDLYGGLILPIGAYKDLGLLAPSAAELSELVKRLHHVVKPLHPSPSEKASLPQCNGFTTPSEKASLIQCNGFTGSSEKAAPKQPKINNPKEPPQVNDQKEPPQADQDRGLASPVFQGDVQTHLDPSDSSDSSDALPPPAASGVVVQVIPAMNDADIVKLMIKQARTAGLDVPPDKQTFTHVASTLRSAIKGRPLLRFIWPNIVGYLANRKNFSSKNLAWLVSHKTVPKPTGTDVQHNWQLVAHWEFQTNTGCYNHVFDKHWHDICSVPYGDWSAKYDALEQTIGTTAGPIVRPKETPPSPWGRKYIGDPEYWGQLCKIEKQVGENCIIRFFDTSGEGQIRPCKLEELIEADADLPTKPATWATTEQHDDIDLLVASLEI